jgi:hypothetical protein
MSILLYIILLCSSVSIFAQQESTREIIRQAMKDEMARNIENLKLENLERPFYISYSIRDVRTMTVTASLGAVVRSEKEHHRNHSVRVMVGDYSRTDENFLDFTGGAYRSTLLNNADELPLEDDYNGIRRALWIATDNVYKSASEKYERKKAALAQQNLSEEAEALEDFSRAPATVHDEPSDMLTMDQIHWEESAKTLSALFREIPDIYSSQTRIFLYRADMYFINSEGTETIQPITLTAVQVNAATQAVDGEPLTDHVLYYGLLPDDLPPLESIKNAVKRMIEELLALRTAAVFDDSYMGPVMLENQAAAEFFSQRLFLGTGGLLAHRKPAVGDARTARYLRQIAGKILEDKINLRILSRDLSIHSLPGMDNFSGQRLIGKYSVDAEGVRPPESITLVENGMLRTLLSNRTPTPRLKQSNGHQRPIVGTGRLASSGLGPGVISVTSSAEKPAKDMKDALLQLAKEEGLDYAIIIRKLKTPVTGIDRRMDPMTWLTMGSSRQGSGSLTDPILVYRVYVDDGREELVRSVDLSDVTLSTMRHIIGVSSERTVYNTLVPAVSGEDVWYSYARRVSTQGIPASFIVPESLILEEMEVENAKRDFTPRMPVVSSPLVGE